MSYVSLSMYFGIYFKDYTNIIMQTIDPTVLLDTLLHMITMENRNFTKTALDGIETLIQALQVLRGKVHLHQ